MIAPPNPTPEDQRREITVKEVHWLTSFWMTVVLRTEKLDHDLALELFRFMSAYALDPESQRERLMKLPLHFRRVAKEMDAERQRIKAETDPKPLETQPTPEPVAVEPDPTGTPALSPENLDRLTYLVTYLADLLVRVPTQWQAALVKIADVAAVRAMKPTAYVDFDWSQSHPIFPLVVKYVGLAQERYEQELLHEAKQNLDSETNDDGSGQ